jgi:hypothetical protein
LIGRVLPFGSLTYSLLSNDTLDIRVKDSQKQPQGQTPLYFFAEEPAPCQYLAVPFFDLKGRVVGFIAADAPVRQREEGLDLFARENVLFLHEIARILSDAYGSWMGLKVDGMADEGAVYFATKIVSSLGTKGITQSIIDIANADEIDGPDPASLPTEIRLVRTVRGWADGGRTARKCSRGRLRKRFLFCGGTSCGR